MRPLFKQSILAACVLGLFAMAGAREPLNSHGGLTGAGGRRAARAPEKSVSGKWIICHYFNWFKTPEGRGGWHNWEWKGNGPKHDPQKILDGGRRDIASVYYPTIGPYDSADRDVIEYHMLSALAAKIDGFFIDWYGIPSDEEKGFPALLDQAGRYGFKMCICFEDKAMFGYYYKAKSREEAVENAVTNLTHVLETHAKHPAYFRIDGVPVVVNFSWSEPTASVQAQGFSAAEWKTILERVRQSHEVYFVHDFHGHVKEQYWDVSDNLYPWLDVNGEYLKRFYGEAARRVAAGKPDSVAALVYPGFDNTGVWGWGNGPFVTPREDGAFYSRSWQMALANPVRFLQIATWNDFGEGATIEPAAPYGYKYLEMTEENAARYKGIKSDGGKWLKLPLAIYEARKEARVLAADDAEERDRKLDAVVEEFAKGNFEDASELLQEISNEKGN